ncbi:MAG: hypothetical protein RL708_1123 [Bacteroidota bacterium]|jgi:hypothetical protein
MLKTVDNLFHITSIDKLKQILRDKGFKPSYAEEKVGDKCILVPMISFSNILVRDIGENEVIDYGNSAICFDRKWGISNYLNPVVYSYEDGLIDDAISFFTDSVLLHHELHHFKNILEQNTNNKKGRISEQINLYKIITSQKQKISNEVKDVFDYLGNNYNEELVDVISNYANEIFNRSMGIIALTKKYIVTRKNNDTKVAYNEREWRKLYKDLAIIFEEEYNYKDFTNKQVKPKPHFEEEKYLLRFSINEIKAILVDTENNVIEITNELKEIFGQVIVEELLLKKKLLIGTKDVLESEGF